MFPFAHFGIGTAVTRAVSNKLPFRWILLGTMLPDFIDKPVFFILGSIKYFQRLGWEPGKRGFAHTLIFFLILIGIARFRRSPAWYALAMGVLTHQILDIVSKSFGGDFSPFGGFQVFLWPFLGWAFPTLSYGMHGMMIWGLEAVGIGLLVGQFAVKRFRPKAV